MGKKGGWFSAIRRAFTPNPSSKDRHISGSEKKTSQEKKRGRGILSHGEFKSFIPLFREPSSIEKILEEADEQKLLVHLYSEQQKFASARPLSPQASSKAASPRITSPRDGSSMVNQNQKETSYVHRAEPNLQLLQHSATRIQAVFRGYMARKSFRALRGLLRLKGVVRGNNAKRQTVNAMKHMQLFVKVQNRIRLCRIEMLKSQAFQSHGCDSYKDGESTLSKCSLLSEAGNNENWDGSMLTKDEVDQRRRRKVEAVMKRERAMAYAYSHKLWNANPKSTMNIRSNGFPSWWKWPESQSAVKNVHQTPTRPISVYGNLEADTPTSTKSSVPMREKLFHTPGRTPPYSSLIKYAHSRASAADSPFKDDHSLKSCPPFSVPNYMTPTISAKAKVRQTANLREGSLGTPSSDSTRRRLSFPLTSNMGSFKWNRGSSKGSAASPREFDRNADRMSVGSTVSMPATVGRKPFNRFV